MCSGSGTTGVVSYNILVVGDGNLSYSRGLAENINGVVIYATTYEGEQELNNK